MKKVYYFIALLLITIQLGAQDFADLVETSKSSVVTIHVIERRNPGVGDPFTKTSASGLGSGVVVGENGKYVLTAAHVVTNASKILVEFYDGKEINAKTIRVSQIADVALIELDMPNPEAKIAKLTDSENVRIGEDVFVIGAPLGLSFSVSRGIISGKHYEKNLTNDLKKMEFFQTDAAINQGNSGGPMFNMDGEVVGIVSSILSFSGGFEGLGFAASSNIAKSILTKKGSVWFGIDALPLNSDLSRLFNVPQMGAIMVQSVTENSPAYFMGMKGGYVKMAIGETEFLAGGDIILSLDKIELNSESSLEELSEYLNNVEPRHQYIVKILRAGEIMELKWRMPE